MSGPAEICDTCGKTITDEELETGSAISVLGRSYCPACKAQAISEISIEDLAPSQAEPKPQAKAFPPPSARPLPQPTPAPARVDAETVRTEPRKSTLPGDTPRTVLASAVRRKGASRKGPKPETLAVGGVVLLAAILGGLLLFRGGPSPEAPPGEGPASRPRTPPPDPAAARQTRAEQAYLKTVALAGQPGVAPAEVLAAIDRVAPDCAGTPFEAKLAQLRTQKQKDKEAADAEAALRPLLEELRTAVAGDPKFARYAELSGKLNKARELALQSVPARVPEINQLRQEYVGRYEKAAELPAQEIEDTAKVLADERRYDDAIAKIETFPREFRLSNAWANLDRLRKDIEQRKKLFPAKK